MGNYTELHFYCELNKKAIEIMPTLMYITGQLKDEPRLPFHHPYFDTEYWKHVGGFGCKSTASDFDFVSLSKIHMEDEDFYLNIRASLKNYNQEIEKFLDLISPYIKTCSTGYMGFMRYQGVSTPTLIYKWSENHKVMLYEPEPVHPSYLIPAYEATI